MFRHMHLPRAGLALLAVVAAASACGDSSLLPPADLLVLDDTVTLWAVTGTAITLPSAFDILLNSVARTDRTGGFDFVFGFVPDTLTGDSVPGLPALLPRGWMGLSADGGLLRVATKFDSLAAAPGSGYDSYAPVYLDTGTVVVARSRTQTCNFGLTSGQFAKVQPVAIDIAARKIVLHVVNDPNCGYRGLQPGLPGI